MSAEACASDLTRRVRPTNPFCEFLASEVEQSIAARFESQVRQHRDRLAVRTEQNSLTYDELNRFANRLVHSIHARTRSKPSAVAILLDHDAPLIAAILAVLKTGRFYVILEPSHPTERLRVILEDSEADLLVTDAAHLSQAQDLLSERCAVLNCDTLEEGTSEENLELDIPSTALAYLVYTSGSTGKPKGVCQTQRNVLHNTRKYTNACHLSAEDRFSLLARCSFSASVSNLFGALLNGAALLPFKVKEEGIASLLRWLAKQEISVYHSVPLVFRNLASELTDEQFPNLRLIKLGGDVITRADFDLFKRHFSERALLYIGFGASEMNCIRYWLLDRESEFDGAIVPVGFEVEDTEVLLLDEDQKDVPSGEVGEIAVRSRYLFPGYWRSSEPSDSTNRLFRTGDLGRMLPNGLLQHLGRNEFQIKIRGARVHAAEIEVALRSLPGINHCAVLAKKISGETELIAYLTSKGDAKPDTATLRSSVAKAVPDYMVPNRFVWLDELPLTNGKIDRKALEQMDDEALSHKDSYIAPRNQLERQLATIWQQVLRKERVGIHDNFFELGGHSLLAGLIAVKVEKLLGRKVPISTIFWSPTVEALARYLEDKEPAASSLVTLQSNGKKPPLFIVHGWGGDVYFLHELAKLIPDRPAYGLQAVGLDGKAPRHISVEEMAAHYIEEIRAFQPEGPYHLVGYSLGGLIAFEMARQLYQRGQGVELLGLLDPPIRPAPWLAYVRTVIPILGPRARFHLQRWLCSWGRESLHLKRRWKTLRRWRARNQSRPAVILSPPEMTNNPPEVSGFRDYYSAVASAYQLQSYPGFVDVIVSDSHPKVLLQLWRHLAKAGVRYHRVPGTHRQMIERHRLPLLAEALITALEDRQLRSKNMAVARREENFVRLRGGHPEFCMENNRV